MHSLNIVNIVFRLTQSFAWMKYQTLPVQTTLQQYTCTWEDLHVRRGVFWSSPAVISLSTYQLAIMGSIKEAVYRFSMRFSRSHLQIIPLAAVNDPKWFTSKSNGTIGPIRYNIQSTVVEKEIEKRGNDQSKPAPCKIGAQSLKLSIWVI